MNDVIINSNTTAAYVLNKIKEAALKAVSNKSEMFTLHYTGHATKITGNWCTATPNQTVSMLQVFQTIKDAGYKGGIYIYNDSCFSGSWA